MLRSNAQRYVIGSLLLAALGCSPAGEPSESAPKQEAPSATPTKAPTKATEAPSTETVTTSAELGKPAPSFTLTDTEGKAHTLADYAGKTVVLEWFNPDCPFVKFAHTGGPLATQAKRTVAADASLVWLSINSGGPGKQGHGQDRNRAARGEYAMENPVLLDESGLVGKLYGAQKTPHLFVIDAQGTLIYRGAIDNAPIGKVDATRPKLPTSKEGELVNYVDAALEDHAAKTPLRLADTPAYGCSVKYQS
jgi:hypothetical protein